MTQQNLRDTVWMDGPARLTLAPAKTSRRLSRWVPVAVAGSLVAGIGAITAAILIATATPPPPVKPMPPRKPFSVEQFWRDSQYMQQGEDLKQLGTAGLAHDRWILRNYKPAPKPAPKPAQVLPRPSWDWRQT